MSRLALALLLSLALRPGAAPAAPHDHEQLPAAQEAARQQHLDDARLALDRGEPDAALVPLEVAAGMSHAADTEMLQLHMLLQGGHVRQALAFAAHAADAHRDEPAARELHLWLLALSGQADHVRRRLQARDERLAILLDALEKADTRLPATAPAPWPHGVRVPDGSRAVATGVLLQGGRRALVPQAALALTGSVWLRNGLGRASRARPAAEAGPAAPAGYSWVEVDPPLPPPERAPSLTRRAGPAFAGSPASRLAMPGTLGASPSWPRLQMGFLGRHDLGWPAGSALEGGPVFDGAGRVIGLASRGPDGSDRLLPWPSRTALPAAADLPVSDDARPRSPDEVYEAALPFVAQVLVAR